MRPNKSVFVKTSLLSHVSLAFPPLHFCLSGSAWFTPTAQHAFLSPYSEWDEQHAPSPSRAHPCIRNANICSAVKQLKPSSSDPCLPVKYNYTRFHSSIHLSMSIALAALIADGVGGVAGWGGWISAGCHGKVLLQLMRWACSSESFYYINLSLVNSISTP